MDFETRRAEEAQLLRNITEALPQLRELLEKVNGHWVYEDRVYRFYHRSFKVFHLQQHTMEIVLTLQRLAPHLTMNEWFQRIISEGTTKKFMVETNHHWLEETRPILEAFFHARYFLEMICKYGEDGQIPEDAPMPSGWACLLYLYGLW